MGHLSGRGCTAPPADHPAPDSGCPLSRPCPLAPALLALALTPTPGAPRTAGNAAEGSEPALSADAVAALHVYAAPVLQLCLALHPLDAVRAARALPSLAPEAGWSLPPGCGTSAAGPDGQRAGPIDIDTRPTAAQQAAAAVCLLSRLRGPAEESVEDGADIPLSVSSAGGAGSPQGHAALAYAEALGRVAAACMAMLAGLFRLRALSAQARRPASSTLSCQHIRDT